MQGWSSRRQKAFRWLKRLGETCGATRCRWKAKEDKAWGEQNGG
ncbi:hypothetical protein MtrunA17_Chr7g0226031 [Medicago truncatula]|uniref:Uncharacterized protein n=1 Tax=Medicago truncatula TaxID=3880 RepID=A0A396GVA0_MEDTR|nr:hypothetical protein MtrunA17_Chr7g0226031 [Medicago truncatula]